VDDAEQFEANAAQCRRLANATLDQRASEQLRNLALEYDARAEAARARAEPRDER
jgi:hypothetical protein